MTVQERAEEMWKRAVRAGDARGHDPPSYEEFLALVQSATHCEYCGRRMTHSDPSPYGRRPSADHRIPLSQGGTNEVSNLAACCWRCNLMKGTATEATYRALIEGKSDEVLEAYFVEACLGLRSARRRRLLALRPNQNISEVERGPLCGACGVLRLVCYAESAGCCAACTHDLTYREDFMLAARRFGLKWE